MINTDYKIGLSDIFTKLVERKFLLASCTFIGFSLGFLYSYQISPQYYIKVNFQTEFYLPSAHRFCGDNIKCLNEETNKRLFQFLDDDWEVNYNHKRIHKISKVDAKKVHQQNIDEITRVFTEFVYEDAKKDLSTLSDLEMSFKFESSNIWRHILSMKRIVNAIENGAKALQFKEIKIKRKTPNYYVNILAFSILACFGGTIIALRELLMGENLEKQK